MMDAKHPGIFIRLPNPTLDQRSIQVSDASSELTLHRSVEHRARYRLVTCSVDSCLEVRSREEWPHYTEGRRKVVFVSQHSLPRFCRRGTRGRGDSEKATAQLARDQFWKRRHDIETEKLRLPEASVSIWEVKVRLPRSAEEKENKAECGGGLGNGGARKRQQKNQYKFDLFGSGPRSRPSGAFRRTIRKQSQNTNSTRNENTEANLLSTPRLRNHNSNILP